ncbi:MAG TPA: PKD domain-containing protein [Bacteroidia bacterium]|nr:PKD domain-containing protein [Bacteroidia bacterium]
MQYGIKVKKYHISIRILLLMMLTLRVGVLSAQIDTAFWFAAPWVTPDHWWKDNVVLHISTFSAPTTTVRIRQPAAIAPNKYDTTIIIGPNSNFNYVFWRDKLASSTNLAFDSLETRPANTVLPYGLYISASSNITVVYAVVTRPTQYLNPETFSLKGQNGMGKEFICPFQTKWKNQTFTGNLCAANAQDLNCDLVVTQPKQQINIVATKPNTVVWITPKCNVIGHLANISYSVMLPVPGSAYTIENNTQLTNVSGNNLSGTIIVANKDIAVTVSDDSVAGVTGCFDLMGDQIVPVEIVGKDYIVVKGAMNAAEPEGAYIVGTQNFTQLTINDGVITNTLINKGDTYHYKTTNSLTSVTANKPVYVLHATGYGCELGEALLPPLSCAGSSLVAFSRNNDQPFRLNILCKNGTQGAFVLNGSPVLVPAGAFTAVPGNTAYVGAQVVLTTVNLPVGSYTISNSLDVFALGVFNGDVGTGGLYHYMSSFLRKTNVNTSTLAPVCVGQNTPITLTGTISGGAITGLWTTNGSGSFGVYTSTNNVVTTTYSLAGSDTNFVGATNTLQFYLTSTGECNPVTDTSFLTIYQKPSVAVGSGTIFCKNNLVPIALSGTVTNAVSGAWSGGNGGIFGPPGPVTSYTPSVADLAANTITLTLSSQGPFPGCVNTVQSLTVSFADPPIVSAGADRTVCTNSSTLDLNGSVNGGTNLGNWTYNGTGLFFPSSASPSATYAFSQSDLQLTQLSLTLTSVFNATNNPANCAAESDVMNIFIVPKPIVLAQPDFTVCASAGAIALSGTVLGSAVSGSWTSFNGTGIFQQLPPVGATYTMSQSDTINGSITFVLNSYGGFCPVETDTVKVSVLKLPLINVNPDNLPVCENVPIALTGTVSGYTSQGTWSSNGSGTFVPVNTVMNATYFPSPADISNGTVVITLTSFTLPGFQNCGSSKSFTSFFVDAPMADFAISPARCLRSPVIFSDISSANGTSGLTYNWNFGDGGISTAVNPVYTYTNPGQYLVTLTVTGTSTIGAGSPVQCPDIKDTVLVIKALPIADFTVSGSCKNNPTEFIDLSTIPAQTENIAFWHWSFGDGKDTLTSTPSATLIHTYTSSVSYNAILTVTTTAGCVSDPKIMPISVFSGPDAEFGMTNNPTVVNEPVYFSDFSTPQSSIVHWYWEFGDQSSSTFSAPVHTYLYGGLITVTLTITDERGCKDVLEKVIDITMLPQLPTAFSPNNDGNNDVFILKGGPFEKVLFRVYNNWGELLFETNDQTLGWDGKWNGVDQPVGVYLWTFVVDMYNNRQVRKTGDVTLIR